MERFFTIGEMVERYKLFSTFEKIEFGQITDDFEMGVEDYKDTIKITTPKVKELAESYITKSYSERKEFKRLIDLESE